MRRALGALCAIAPAGPPLASAVPLPPYTNSAENGDKPLHASASSDSIQTDGTTSGLSSTTAWTEMPCCHREGKWLTTCPCSRHYSTNTHVCASFYQNYCVQKQICVARENSVRLFRVQFCVRNSSPHIAELKAGGSLVHHRKRIHKALQRALERASLQISHNLHIRTRTRA